MSEPSYLLSETLFHKVVCNTYLTAWKDATNDYNERLRQRMERPAGLLPKEPLPSPTERAEQRFEEMLAVLGLLRKEDSDE